MTLYLRLVLFEARLCIKILELEEQILAEIDSDRSLLKRFFKEDENWSKATPTRTGNHISCPFRYYPCSHKLSPYLKLHFFHSKAPNAFTSFNYIQLGIYIPTLYMNTLVTILWALGIDTQQQWIPSRQRNTSQISAIRELHNISYEYIPLQQSKRSTALFRAIKRN